MRGAPFGPSPQTPLPPHDGRAPQAGRLTEACCRFRLGASTRAQPPLQHHSDGDPTWRPDHDLPVEGKDDGRATKAAFSGRSSVSVRNLMLRTIRQAPPWRATLKGSPLRFAPLRSLRDALGGSSRIRASRLRTTTKEEPLMKTLVTFCQKTGRRLRQFINRQIAKLSHKGQLRFSIAVMLPLIAKVEFSYQVELNSKAGNDNKPQ